MSPSTICPLRFASAVDFRGLKQKPSASEKTVNGSWKDIALSGLSQMNSFQKRNGSTGALLQSEGFIAVSVLRISGIQRCIEINDLIKRFPPFFSNNIVPLSCRWRIIPVSVSCFIWNNRFPPGTLSIAKDLKMSGITPASDFNIWNHPPDITFPEDT